MKMRFFLVSLLIITLSCSSDEISTSVSPPPMPIVKFTITLSAGEGGTVSTTGGEYEAGQTVSVTASPQGEYIFKDWSDGNTNATRTITVNSNTNLTANFEKKKYPLTINIEGEGGVLEEIVNAGRTTDYDSGTTVKLTAVAAEGWEFVKWTGAIESSEMEVQLFVNEAKEVSGEFKLVFNLYELEINHPMKIDIWSGLGITSNSNIMIEKGGELNLISHPADPRGSVEKFFPSLHFVKINDIWQVQNYFENINMSFGGRDVHPFGSNNDFVWADHGTEVWLGGGEGTPYNNIWTATNISRNDTKWTKVNEYRSFYHGVSSGDLNNDGLEDVIGIHMGTKAPEEDYKYHTKYHVFYQRADGSFEQKFDVLEYPKAPLPSYFSWNDENIEEPLGVIRASILIDDITGDGFPEVIGGASIHKSEWDVPLNAQNSLEIFSDIDSDGKYEVLNIQDRIGLWEFDNMSASQIKAMDYDKDGDKDLIINFEGSKGNEYLHSANFNGIQVFNNLGEGKFEYSEIEIPFEDVRISEFELIDVDSDNDLDIVFNANLEIDLGSLNGIESSFYYNNQNRLIKDLEEFDENYFSAILDLDEMIYFNDNGSFNKHNNGFKIKINKAKPKLNGNAISYNTGLKTLNATIVNGKLKFYGYTTDVDFSKPDNDSSKYLIRLFEYEPIFK